LLVTASEAKFPTKKPAREARQQKEYPIPELEMDALLTLTERNFSTILSRHDRVLVQWIAPWCAQCTRAMPKLREAAEVLISEGLKTLIAKVDATEEKQLASKYNVGGPRYDYFVREEISAEYQGSEQADAVTQFLRAKEQPEVSELKEEEVSEFLEDGVGEDLTLVARVPKKTGGKSRHSAFLNSLGDINDALSSSADLRFAVVFLPEDADNKKDSSLVMHRPDFSADVVFEGAWSKKNIAEWASTNSFASLGASFSPKYRPGEVAKLGFKGSVVFCLGSGSLVEDKAGREETARTSMEAAAEEYPAWKFTLCAEEDLQGQDKEMLFGNDNAIVEHATLTVMIPITDDPLLSVRYDKKTYDRYVREGQDLLDSQTPLKQFLADVKAGKAPRRYKSESKPLRKSDEHGVVVVTGESFEDIVKDPTKDVFVDYWHPRCEHCMELTPVWQNLASEVKRKGWDKKGVVIAMMDMSKNECEEEVLELPKLVMYPAVAKNKKMKKKQVFKPARVEKLGDLELAPLLEFIGGSAISVEGEEESELEAEVASSMKRRKRKGTYSKSSGEL